MKDNSKIIVYVIGGIALATGIYYLADNEKVKTMFDFIKDKIKQKTKNNEQD